MQPPRLLRLQIATICLLIALMACSVLEQALPMLGRTATPTTKPATRTPRPDPTATPLPTLGSEEKPILWAFMPEGEIERIAALAEAIDMIFADTGLVIEPFVVTDYHSMIDAMCSDPPMAHMASMPVFHYLLANDLGCAEAALAGAKFGNLSYNGQFIARTESEIQDLQDIAGLSFCRSSELNVSGWLVPSLEMMAAGVDLDTLQIIDTGSHDNTVIGVYRGDCDVGATYDGAQATVQDQFPDMMDVIEIIALTVSIPLDGVQYSPTFSPELRDQINAALLAIARTEAGAQALYDAFFWTTLAERDHSFYLPLLDLIDAAGSTPLDIFD